MAQPTKLAFALIAGGAIFAHLYQPALAEESETRHESGNTLGVFLGDTTEDRREGATLGLEFEHRFSEHYGVGVTAEHVVGDFDTNVLAIPVAVHSGPWKLYAGPGMEYSHGHGEPLLRLGAEYGFHVGEYEISPQVDVDFVDGERLLVFGLVFALEL